ncbi:molecular chaperone (small heat shock protein) [Desulfocapsa sulfexigens DSM 10523]|uniref:Molecular chaperone (Small heat shock protein) n=1 Tax=Desulfocapsa sulfexigens (strain DSM 10523 / SB164P1) TaxID=1167006 RepID=M1NDE0_DESSD|nr:Hsp20/alpha crystallin family protein [Desulfocapsa sulfexigens]AGF77779.1 molecular chaperone (small heat shock protein) [Desulfocapsa sulfexigens DSM 10523]
MNKNMEITKRTENMVEKQQDLATIAPVVDIYENDEEILLHADMPGVTKDKISVNVDNGKLEISGVRNLQRKGVETWQEFYDVEYKRVFSVPQTIDVAKVNAELKDGTLKLHLPKAEAAMPRTIEIRSA